MKKFNKEEMSWILYDCGNSAYSMTVTTALFPVYFSMVNKSSSMDLGYFASMAGILVAILSPILGTIADYKGYKKKFFVSFTLVGIISTLFLSFVPTSPLWVIMIPFLISTVGFSGANIFYDAFLVDVTPDEKMDLVSGYGFALGYIASVIPFAICLAAVYLIGMKELLGYQISFVITGLWWFLLSIPVFKNVKQVYGVEPEKNPVKKSFMRILKTVREISKHKLVFTFLMAYFLYIDGVDTIIRMVVPYATSALGTELDMFMLLGILLIIQLIAFPFAILYGQLANKFGTKRMIVVAILTYIVSVFFAYFINSVTHIFILGALVGSAQGGIQALSRSYFARIIPKENSNEFFGFYNVFGKFAAIFGPVIMALITSLTGNARLSILGILPLFILGLIVLLRLPKAE